MNELLSVIVPVYNGEETIKESLDSIRRQTYKNMEIIVVDDGSTDQTNEYLQDMVEADERICLVEITHQGTGSARNAGLSVAKGTYVYFADADDQMEPEAAASMVKAMDTSSCDLLIFGYRQKTRKNASEKVVTGPRAEYAGRDIRGDYTHFIGGGEPGVLGSCWNKCFKMSLIREHGISFPDLCRNEEGVFLMRYLEHTDKILKIPDLLYVFYPIDMEKAKKVLQKNYCDEVEAFRKIRLDYASAWGCDHEAAKGRIAGEYWGKMMLGLRLCKYSEVFPPSYEDFCQRADQLMKGLKSLGNVPAGIKRSKTYLLLRFGLKKMVWKNL